MRELVLKKCLNCGAIIRVVKDCTCDDCGIMCCDKKMVSIKSNDVDASFEKHVPTYEIDKDNLIVTVSHVMDEDHYIEWIAFINNEREEYVYFKPGDEAKAMFKYGKGKIYSYCNKHSLWTSEVK